MKTGNVKTLLSLCLVVAALVRNVNIYLTHPKFELYVT